MATAALLTAGGSGVDTTRYDTATFSVPANRVVLATIGSRSEGATAEPPSELTSPGVTWELISSQNHPDLPERNTAVYRAQTGGAATASGALTIQFPSSVKSCIWVVSEHGGLDRSGANGVNAIIRTVFAHSTVSGTAPSVSNPGVDPASASYGAVYFGDTATFTPPTGWTELGEASHSGPTRSMQAQFQNAGVKTSSWTASVSSSWSAVIIELRNETTNLLDANSATFEGGIGNWVGFHNAVAPVRSSAQADASTWSLVLQASANGHFIYGTSAGPAVTPGSFYRIRARLRAATVGQPSKIFVDWIDSTGGASVGTNVTEYIISSTDRWQSYEEILQAPTGAATARIRVWVGASELGPLPLAGEITYVDNASIALVGTNPLGQLLDPDTATVEESKGKLRQSAVPLAAVRTTDVAAEGAAAIQWPVDITEDVFSAVWFGLPMVKPGNSYRILAKSRPAAAARRTFVNIEWFNASFGFINNQSSRSYQQTLGEWTAISHVLVAPAGAAYARPRLFVAASVSGTDVLPIGEIHYGDDFQLISIGVPAKPTVTVNQASGQADPATTTEVNFTAVFSEPMEYLAPHHITLGGTAGPTTVVVTGSGTTFNLAVSGMTADGTVIASIAADKTFASTTGGYNQASTSTDNTINWANTAPPTVTVEQAATQDDPTRSGMVVFTVKFNKPVTGFTASDVTIGGTAGATTAFVSGSGTDYTIAIVGMVRAGTVTASIPSGKAQSAAGVGNNASTSVDNVVTWIPPSPNSIILTGKAATAGPPAAFMRFEEIPPGSTVWQVVRGAGRVPVVAGVAVAINYWAVRGAPHQHRVRSIGVGATGDVYSPPSPVLATTLPIDEKLWFKTLNNPELNQGVEHTDTACASDSEAPQGIFWAEGRKGALVHHGTIRGEVFGSLQLFFYDDWSFYAFQALRELKQPVLMQTLFGDRDLPCDAATPVYGLEQFWVTLGSARVVRLARGSGTQYRRVEVPAVQVQVPPG